MLIVHPDSHVHSDLLPEHVAWALNKFKNRDGFFKESVAMPKSLPALDNALYGPTAGDPPVAESEVVYVHRPGGKSRLGKSRMVHRPMRKTRVITVIAGPHDGHPMVVYAMHGGHPAEREPFDEDIKTPAQQAAADAFWATHALATGKKAKARANANDETRMYLKRYIERLGEGVDKINAAESFIRGRQQDDATITDDEDAALERAMVRTKAARESAWSASKEVGSVAYPKARANVGDAAGNAYAHLSDAQLDARITTASQGMAYWRGYNPSFYDMAEAEWDALTAEKKRRAGAARSNGGTRTVLARASVGNPSGLMADEIPVGRGELNPDAFVFYNGIFHRLTGKAGSRKDWTHLVTRRETTTPGWGISTFIFLFDGVEVARKVFEDAPESEDSPARENSKRRTRRKK